ncbi:Patatin-like phospholipase [Mobiluncus mulieris]|nr:Patatin-like phospholipase [Mobiluncus mulieris]
MYVDYVAGISAGATCLVNYLARLPQRSRRCFIDVSTYSAFGGWKTAIKGKGIFDTHHMYYDMTEPGGMLELDYERFAANPALWRVGVCNAERGENVYFGADQVHTEQKLTHVCRASGSMPIATPVTYIAGEACMDGAIDPSGGVPSLNLAVNAQNTARTRILSRWISSEGSRELPEFQHTVMIGG